MAPSLAASTLALIHDIIVSNELTVPQMAEAAGCNECTIRRLRSNMRQFGNVKAPPNKKGRPRGLTPAIIQALCDHLLEKPYLYLDEMVLFVWDEFQEMMTTCCISRAVKREGWSKKPQSRKQENEMQIYETHTLILFLIFAHIISFT
jgi:transposase